VTVSRALAQLASEGLVITRPGAGSFVTERVSVLSSRHGDTGWQSVPLADRVVDASRLGFLLRATPEGSLSLAAGYPHSDLMPTRALAAAVTRAARRSEVWDPPPPSGLQRLRLWIARSLGGSVDADDVVITGGGQAALSTAFRAILPPGAPLLVESPTYLGALAVARAAGLRPVPVPVDKDGLLVDQLSDAFASTGARAVYCQPTFHNPTGTVLAESRRDELLAVAAASGAFVIEDGFSRWLAHERPAPPALVSRDDHGRVVHISSLTKATSPNLRIGALVARGQVAERLRSLRLVDDFFASRLLQETVLELVESPAWPRHLKGLASALTVRRDALVRAISRDLPAVSIVQVPAGGMHLWARLPDGLDDVSVAEAAERAGVLVSAGRPFFAAEPPAPHLRLAFGGAAHPGELEEAVARLALAVPQ
jgi:DNA-binding transcriptional MocR family regulator